MIFPRTARRNHTIAVHLAILAGLLVVWYAASFWALYHAYQATDRLTTHQEIQAAQNAIKVAQLVHLSIAVLAGFLLLSLIYRSRDAVPSLWYWLRYQPPKPAPPADAPEEDTHVASQ